MSVSTMSGVGCSSGGSVGDGDVGEGDGDGGGGDDDGGGCGSCCGAVAPGGSEKEIGGGGDRAIGG
eukprot:1711934-Prymnesium_polylepis.2